MNKQFTALALRISFRIAFFLLGQTLLWSLEAWPIPFPSPNKRIPGSGPNEPGFSNVSCSLSQVFAAYLI